MSDLLKSAFGYFSSPNNGQVDNNFVGQIVEISNVKLRVKKVIAEGVQIYCFILLNIDFATIITTIPICLYFQVVLRLFSFRKMWHLERNTLLKYVLFIYKYIII